MRDCPRNWICLLLALATCVAPAESEGMSALDSYLDIAADSDFETNTFTWFILLRPNNPGTDPSQTVLVSSYADINGDGTPEENFAAENLWGVFLENTLLRSYARTSTGSIRSPVPAANATDQWTLVSSVWDGDAGNTPVTQSINGNSRTVTGATATPLGHDGTRIGAGPPGPNLAFDGDIAEILIYDIALDTASRQAIDAYLFNKWVFDLPATPPSTTNLLVWLKADTGVVPDDGNGQFIWEDQSPYGGDNDAKQAKDWHKPVLVADASYNNDLPVVRFGRHYDTTQDLSEFLLKINPEQKAIFAEGKSQQLLDIQPLILPDDANYVGNCWHLGWPVATIVDGTILVIFHRTPQHHQGLRSASNNCKTKTLVMRSTDGGETWTGPVDLADFVVTPTANVQMVFGNAIGTTALGEVFVVSPLGVFRSDDAGLSWTHLSGAFSAAQLPTDNMLNGPRIVEHPTFGLVVASHREDGVNPDGTVKVADAIWLRYSTDGGWTWQEMMQATPSYVQPVEPAGLYLDGSLFYHARAHGSFDASNKTYRYAQLTSASGWLPFSPALTNMRTTDRRDENGFPAYQGPWSQDTSDMSFNPVTGRVEVVVTNREGLGSGQEDVRLEETQMTLNLFSIDPADLEAGESDWQFEGTLLTRYGTHASGDQDSGARSDGMHPGGAVIDAARGMQHIFVYLGNAVGPTGIYHIKRTLNTPALRCFLGPRPATAAEPIAWLQADKGVNVDSGGFVQSWSDQWTLDGHHDATQDDAQLRPQRVPNGAPNGVLPAIAFDGVDDFLDIDGDVSFDRDELTWFAVFRTSAPADLQHLLIGAYTSLNGGLTHPDNFGSNHAWGTFLEANKYRSFARDLSGSIKTPFPPGDTSPQWVMLSGSWAADDNVRQWTNGASDGARSGATGEPAGHKRTRIGADPQSTASTLSGEVAEIIVYGESLSDTDRQSVETYLQQKWFPLTGDVDGNGCVTLGDAMLQLACLSGPTETSAPSGCPGDEFLRSDCDDDGDVDLADVATLVQLIEW